MDSKVLTLTELPATLDGKAVSTATALKEAGACLVEVEGLTCSTSFESTWSARVEAGASGEAAMKQEPAGAPDARAAFNTGDGEAVASSGPIGGCSTGGDLWLWDHVDNNDPALVFSAGTRGYYWDLGLQGWADRVSRWKNFNCYGFVMSRDWYTSPQSSQWWTWNPLYDARPMGGWYQEYVGSVWNDTFDLHWACPGPC